MPTPTAFRWFVFCFVLPGFALGSAERSPPDLLAGRALSLSANGVAEVPARAEIVAVEHPQFDQALRVDTSTLRAGGGEVGLIAHPDQAVQAGDVLWLSFFARKLTSTRETGEAYFEVRVDRLVDGRYAWPSFLEQGISVGSEWTQVSVPFEATHGVTPDQLRLVIKFDTYPQVFELSPIRWLNYGKTRTRDELPKTQVRYGGDDPVAAWRAAAAERIEKHRKANLAVKVVDAQGRPVAGARVAVSMKRLDFAIGTAVATKWILDQESADARRYREHLKKYYNQVVFDNEMKWPHWAEPNHRPDAVLRSLDWLDAQGISARGHVMVWPSWRYVPSAARELKDEPAQLRRLVLDHIARQTSLMRGRFAEWDVSNELYAHHSVLDAVGWDALPEWYRAARAGEPGARLYYNEYTMFHAEGPASPSEHFYSTVKKLKDQGAPIGGIGEQAHIGGNPPSIPLVLERLDRFAQLGLPILITEFDINSPDDDYKARYTRDFMTAVFSHPATVGIMQWGFWEGHHWFPIAAYWNKDWTLRPQGEVFVNLVTNEWRTDTVGIANDAGTFDVRAYRGTYRLQVDFGGQSASTEVDLSAGDLMTVVELP